MKQVRRTPFFIWFYENYIYKNTHCLKIRMDSTNGAGTTGHPHAKEQWWLGGNLDTDLTSFAKMNLK